MPSAEGANLSFTLLFYRLWMAFPFDRFTFRLLMIGVLVVAASVAGSVGLTHSLTAGMGADIRGPAIAIALAVPMIVAPLAAGAMIWMVIRNHRLLIEVDRLANHDDLTGLMNRRAFLGRANAQMASGTGGGTALALADLDHFKAVNDSYGHAAGDTALRHVANRLAQHAPEGSLVARLGDEEFAILFEWTSLRDAQAMMERVGHAIAASPCAVDDGAQVRITVSIGLAVAGTSEDIDTLLRRADAAMYAAKHGGRNQTKLAA